MTNAIHFLLGTIADLFILAFVLRLVLQAVRADFYNPISQAILRITNPLVIPARRFIPAAGKLDLATLVVIFALELATVLALWGFQNLGQPLPFPGLGTLFNLALFRLLNLVLQFYFFAMLIYALLSWFGPHGQHPAGRLLGQLCEPLLRPVRRLLPPAGGLDFSVLIVLLLLQALQIALR